MNTLVSREGRVQVFRPLAIALAKVAMKIDPGVVGRLYLSFTVKQRADFWEALETTVPDEWHKARHDLRRPLTTPSEASEQTIGDEAGAGAVLSGVREAKLGWARPAGYL